MPSTFVVTNSEPPCSIDFSTCDSAAAFTITSTSATICAHELRVADVALHEREPRVRHHVGEVLEVAGVRQRVERDDLVRRGAQQVAHEVRGDEPGAAGDEDALAICHGGTLTRGRPARAGRPVGRQRDDELVALALSRREVDERAAVRLRRSPARSPGRGRSSRCGRCGARTAGRSPPRTRPRCPGPSSEMWKT